MDAAFFFDETSQYQQCRHGFRYDCGDCNTHDVHLKADDKQQIQNHIDDAGTQQEIQRTFGVTHCTEQGAAEVIDHGRNHTKEIDTQVNSCQRQHLFRRLHPDQHLLCANDAQNQQQRSAQHTEEHGGMYRPAQIIPRLCTVVPGSNYVCADRQSNEQVGQQVYQRCI